LEICKSHFSVADSKGKGSNKGVENEIQTTNEVRDEVSPLFSLTDVFNAGFASLL